MNAICITLILLLLTISECPTLADLSTALAALNSLKILRKPGECETHHDYPNTFQCAESKKCISASQFKDGKCDCCVQSAPKDTSDEADRCEWSNENCKSHPDYVYNMTFQCVKTKRCLSRLRDHMNGRCDCCPEVTNGDCSKCNDATDEECLCTDWSEKFYCDGNCVSIKLWQDGKKDCPYSCIEPDVKAECLNKKTRSADTMEYDFCDKLRAKNYPYYNCTSERKCIPDDMVRNGQPNDCVENEDEDPALHPNCPQKIAQTACDPNFSQCILVDNKTPHCRCANSNGFRTCFKGARKGSL